MFEELDNIIEKNLILKPCLNDYCDNCRNSYWLDGDEQRCKVIKLGSSDAMCIQIVRCIEFKAKPMK